MTGSLAKRYARALASIAQEEGTLEAVEGELDKTASWLADPELAEALESPALKLDNRLALIKQITESLELSELSGNFLQLLTRSQRLDQFPGIVRAYRKIVDDEMGRIRGSVRAATELSDDSVREIADAFEKVHGKKVLLDLEVVPELAGGITVELAGRVYDGSVRTQLSHLAKALARDSAG